MIFIKPDHQKSYDNSRNGVSMRIMLKFLTTTTQGLDFECDKVKNCRVHCGPFSVLSWILCHISYHVKSHYSSIYSGVSTLSWMYCTYIMIHTVYCMFYVLYINIFILKLNMIFQLAVVIRHW